jgi:outer membrane protein OmpA-like peptidoglycan-associated protein
MAMVKVPPPAKETPKTKPGLEDGAFRFKLGSDKLDAKSEALLDSVAQKMIEFPEAIIEVSGHTCNIGSKAGNLKLSKKRAAAVRKYLMEYDGIDPKRIKTAGYADERPLVPNINEPNRKKNRRVAFKMKFPDKE